jgi:aspartyl-tRNA(Asn)/glutamyl-tRNA(Gln) amidotransferase subunit B
VGGDISSAKYVLVDYNRSGIPLVEIVTEPDFSSVKEVREFLSKLSSILEHLEVYDPNREASLRVDANISLEGGTRVEIKNISGFANVEKALSYEVVRQENLLRMGQKIDRETRHFDADTKSTTSLRKKEFEEDYGYIFEPDLTDIEISNEWLMKMEKAMPELPDARIKRFMQQYKIREREAKIIVYVDKSLADFFEACCKLYRKYEQLSFWAVGDLLKNLNLNDLRIKQSKVEPKTFVELLEMIDSGKITGKLAKEIIKEFVATGKSPKEIVKKKKIVLIEDAAGLEKIVKDVIAKNKKAFEDYKSGKHQALGFLIGEVMKRTKSAADPKLVKKLIEKTI